MPLFIAVLRKGADQFFPLSAKIAVRDADEIVSVYYYESDILCLLV
jgi:hypothetical protein